MSVLCHIVNTVKLSKEILKRQKNYFTIQLTPIAAIPRCLASKPVCRLGLLTQGVEKCQPNIYKTKRVEKCYSRTEIKVKHIDIEVEEVVSH